MYVFSFAIVLWEVASGGGVPYAGLSPLQAAVGVVQHGLRPPLPAQGHPALARLMVACWAQQPAARPAFSAVVERLEALEAQLREAGNDNENAARSGGDVRRRPRERLLCTHAPGKVISALAPARVCLPARLNIWSRSRRCHYVLPNKIKFERHGLAHGHARALGQGRLDGRLHGALHGGCRGGDTP